MNRTQLVARCSAAAGAATIMAALAVAPATARLDPGAPIPNRFPTDGNCVLTRIGSQLTRCDYLTGGGVPAPRWVPEYESAIERGW